MRNARSPSAQPDSRSPTGREVLRELMDQLGRDPDQVIGTGRHAGVRAQENQPPCPLGMGGGEDEGHGSAF